MAAALLTWLIAVGAYDFRQRRVPNWLVLFGAVLAFVALSLKIQPFAIDWPQAVLGAVVGFIGLLIFYVTGYMGAGDVKFAGALGLWLGVQPLWPIWLGASLIAGVHAVLWLLLQRWPVFPRLTQALSGAPFHSNDGAGARKRQRHIPFAAYLAIASVGWLIWRNSTY